MKKEKKQILRRGGTDTERLYLKSASFTLQTGDRVVVQKTRSALKGYSMTDHVTRHKGRYGIVGLFARPGKHMLDFPCGSGYPSEFLRPFSLHYQGLDNDPATVAYAQRMYGNSTTNFAIGNLKNPTLPRSAYDMVACIEGIEHIEQKYQAPLVEALVKSVKPGGVLIISSPENPTGISGPSKHNKDHLWELNRKDFLDILYKHFAPKDVEVVTQTATLSTGVTTTCLYAICHKHS